MVQSRSAILLAIGIASWSSVVQAATLPGPAIWTDPGAGSLKEAEVDWFPYHVQLLVDGQDPPRVCNGALISDRHVLTAASCLSNAQAANLTIVYGSLQQVQNSTGLENAFLATSIVTPSAGGDSGRNFDVALVTFTTQNASSPALVPVELVVKGARPIGYGRITGFGASVAEEGGSSQGNTLKYVDLPLLNDEECEHTYSTFDDDYELCAGALQGNATNACQGFEGSPLVAYASVNGAWKPYLVGLVTASSECGNENRVGKYAKVKKLRSFIAQQLAAPTPAAV